MVRIIARPLLLLLVVLSANGCSLALIKKPRLAEGPAARDCTTSPVAPILDVAAAGASAALLVRGLSNDDSFFDGPEWDAIAVAVLGGPALLWGYSAARGFGWTSECRSRQSVSEEAITDYLRTLATPSITSHPGDTER
ncbi:MAG: hypothetical protein OXH46_08160 [Gemmatimonadetes bacterium]|nr:hypothetical protein [Gemmatimonadota bacterium]